jgi:ABC-type dipeptide/oligopeptide/nickel transport system ATPase subunit
MDGADHVCDRVAIMRSGSIAVISKKGQTGKTESGEKWAV